LRESPTGCGWNRILPMMFDDRIGERANSLWTATSRRAQKTRIASLKRASTTKSPGARAEACDPARVHPANQSSGERLAANFEQMMTELAAD